MSTPPQEGRVSVFQQTDTPDAVAIAPEEAESTLPVATDTGIRQMTTVDATLTMPPASPQDMDELPGFDWHYKIDGEVFKKGRQRVESETGCGFGRAVQTTCIGDFGFADDPGIVCSGLEVIQAD